MEELFASLARAKAFSKMDLSHVYISADSLGQSLTSVFYGQHAQRVV